MLKNNYRIFAVALIFGLIAYLAEASIDFLLSPSKSFLDQMFFDLTTAEIYERLILLGFVTVAVIIALKSAAYQQKAREVLWEGERLLESICASIQEGLIIKDHNFVIMRINQVVARWFDYAMPLVGRKCYEALKGRQAPCPECPTARAFESGQAAHEIMPKPGPGGQDTGWLDLYAYPLVDSATGKISGVVEFARDITQHQEAKKALRESEKRYQLLVDNIPAVVFKGFMDWTIDFYDNKIEELTGYHRDEFNSRRMIWRDLILPEDLKDAQKAFVHALKTDKTYVREYRIRHRDGRLIWIQARGQILFDSEGKFAYVFGVFFDITERKQTEEQMAQLASFPQLNPDPVLELDSSGKITFRNAAAIQVLESLGVEEGEQVFFPEDLDEILQTGKTTEGVSRYYREVRIKDAVFGENIEFVPQYDVARIRAADITERKRTEEALRHSQDSLAEAQRLAQLGNWDWHIRRQEIFWSDEVYRILGLTPGECTPSFVTYLKAVHPDDHAQAKKAFSDALHHGKPYRIMHRIVRSDASQRFVYAQGEILYDDSGQAVRMMGTIQDITERRLAQEALLESERRYRLLAEHVTDVIWTTDLEMNLTFVSPSIQWLTGYEVGEYMKCSPDRRLTPASLMIAQNRLSEELLLADEYANPARSSTLELELRRRDGSTVWAEVKASLWRDEQGRPVGILGVTRDISARRKLEAQLLQAQKMEVVGRLAGGVAHDFNNLLTAILGYSDLLSAHLDVRDPAYQDVIEIKKAGERASLLTRQLLAFSRRQVMQPKSLHLNRVIENLVKMLKRVIGEDIRLELIYGDDLGNVLADPGQIEQVILNLTVNARDAMPQGGKLTIQTGNVELDEAYAQVHAQVQPGHYVLLTVSDTGCGMDAATRSHLFEPFFTTKEVGKGTGLGLSTVYGIVHQSNGHIYVYSEPGQGASFKIYLPRVRAEAELAVAGINGEVALQGHENILLVEDDEGVRDIAGRILRRSGYQVLEARDGAEALQISRNFQGKIHLVLTDLIMPGFNGRQLVLRLASLRPGIKVVFMSGYAEEGIIDKEVLGPGDVFIQKPFEAHVLTRKIWELLNSG